MRRYEDPLHELERVILIYINIQILVSSITSLKKHD